MKIKTNDIVVLNVKRMDESFTVKGIIGLVSDVDFQIGFFSKMTSNIETTIINHKDVIQVIFVK